MLSHLIFCALILSTCHDWQCCACVSAWNFWASVHASCFLLCFFADLANMYELLSPVEDSLDMFAMELEEHLTNTGLAVMQSLQGENVR